MPTSILPRAAIPAGLPSIVRLQIVSSTVAPPEGDDWLHEVKHDGHRLVAIVAGSGALRLLSRNGIDRTALFCSPFREFAANARQMVLDGEIAVPDDRGVTHLDWLSEALAGKRSDRLAYFAFDLLHIDGHDLRRCPVEERKALLRRVLDETPCERIVYVDHVIGQGAELFERVRQVGAEGIVSKRADSAYRGGESRDWLKTKCFEIGRFTITGFQELGEGRLEAIHVAEECGGTLHPVGQIRFGFAGKRLWNVLDKMRDKPARHGVVPVPPLLTAEVKFFGRHKGGSIRDGVILSLHTATRVSTSLPAPISSCWQCDAPEVIAAFD